MIYSVTLLNLPNVFGVFFYVTKASNFDEMSIKQHEPLELIADGDGEGWVKVRYAVCLMCLHLLCMMICNTLSCFTLHW